MYECQWRDYIRKHNSLTPYTPKLSFLDTRLGVKIWVIIPWLCPNYVFCLVLVAFSNTLLESICFAEHGFRSEKLVQNGRQIYRKRRFWVPFSVIFGATLGPSWPALVLQRFGHTIQDHIFPILAPNGDHKWGLKNDPRGHMLGI